MADVSESSSRGSVSIRACQNCSRAKAKCVTQSSAATDNRCARCYRLNKECTVVPRAVRKRRSPNVATNTAKLEQKIESLVNLLANAQGVNLDQLTPPESNAHSEPSPAPQHAEDVPVMVGPLGRWEPGFPAQSVGASGITPISLRPAEFPGTATLPTDISLTGVIKQHFSSNLWKLSDQEGEQLFVKFQEQFLLHFPFIMLLSKYSEMKSRKPYVLKATWTIAYQSQRARQIDMCKDLMVDISTSMLVRGERNLDMLECLILLNAWAYFVSPVPPSSKSTALYQLTIGLLFDLKLTRPIREYDGPGEMLAECQTRNIPDCSANDTAKRTSDECRALLCCFYLGSVYSLCVKRTEGLNFSPYIDFCAQTLEERAEHESDILLVSLVRLECIITPVDNLLTKKSFADDYRAPISMHIKAVRTNMERFWVNLSHSIQQHPLMRLSYDSNFIFLYEPSLYKSLFPSTSSCGHDTSQRIDLLHNCMMACKKLLDEYLKQPLWSCYGTCVADLAPLGRAISSLLKLCLVEEAGWDLSLVRQTANLEFYFEQLLAKYQQVGADLDGRQQELCRNSFFTGCARAMGVIKTWYETKIMSDSTQSALQDQTYDVTMMGEQANFIDDAYWMEFMGDWTMLP
ncbi:uncharacterized protein LY89DRAFT_663914 [Mollisia scopiformis]|uniref:Zn(2)-C6 fungal-type domain-containing protein n=1 Tax=Mollisia scopiformis TaxID=149040 RepID=A0A194XT50_MOLSC|nr:uncharacterized protein LY89DRAFT_663914 [Mollisia scopiformis]KUJ23485.1 hypothetical protein LY89DRAFT_663914 [Mollisia scopiformis]